jgi:tetratricopeptide (TPR) repeat protein
MQLEARDEIQAEIENIRAATNWGIAKGNQIGVLAALKILSEFYFIQGYYEAVESYKTIARIIEDQYRTGYDPSKPGSLMYYAALGHQAFYLSMLGSIEKADEIARKILPGLQELDIRPEMRNCLMSLGINAAFRGDYENAVQDLKETLNIAERNQQSFWIVGSKIWLGWVYYEQGDHAAALKEWQEGEDISIDMKNRLLLAFVQSKLALLGEETGDYENAIKIQLQARENFEQFGDQVGVGYATSRLALSLIGIGEYREAKRFGQEALQSYKEMNHRWGIPASLCRIGFAEIGMGEYEAAWVHLIEALDLSKESQIGTLVLYSLIGLGQLLAKEEQFELGVKILSFVAANPITPSLYREMAAKSLGEIENKFPADEFKAASKAGEKADVEEIVNSLPSSLTEP